MRHAAFRSTATLLGRASVFAVALVAVAGGPSIDPSSRHEWPTAVALADGPVVVPSSRHEWPTAVALADGPVTDPSSRHEWPWLVG